MEKIKKVQVGFRLEEDLLIKLKEIKAETGSSLEFILNKIVRVYFNENK